MKHTAACLCLLLAALLTLAACRTAQGEEAAARPAALSETRTEELHALSARLAGYINAKDEAGAIAMMDETMAEAMTGKLEGVWGQLTDALGPFLETGGYEGSAQGEFHALEMTLIFEKGTLIQRTVFDSENRVAGLFFRHGEITAAPQAPPEGVEEIALIVDAGEGFPLNAVLSLPKGESPAAALVLIHGSGPSDMNETVGANTLFRDLAWALAAKGIAVLRYDKRTYTYGARLNEAELTIGEEAIADALAAVALLQARPGIDEGKIFLLGHSMGGALLSTIHSLGASCAGYVIMAGSPRPLWALSAEQNLLLAQELAEAGEEEQAAALRRLVAQETEKAARLSAMSREEALADGGSIFGMPVAYLQSLAEINTLALHQQDGLPCLVLQGEADRQVGMEDFALWQQGLAGQQGSAFISYPGLNHLFGRYSGDAVPFSQLVSHEYAQKTPVPAAVTGDIARWILELAGER